MTRYIPLLVLLLAAPALAQDIPITFRVDASPLGPRGDALPNILPGDAFGIRGGVAPVGWDTTTPLEDPNGDGIWEGTILFPASEAGTTLNWKVVGDRTASLGSAQPAWEPAPGDPSNFGNRELTIEPQTVDVMYLGLLNDFVQNAQPVGFDYRDTYSDDYGQGTGLPMVHDGYDVQDPSCGATFPAQGDLWYQIDPDLVMGNTIQVTATATGDDLFVDEPTPYVVEILTGPVGGPFSVVDCASGTNDSGATGFASGVATGAVTYVRVVGLIDLDIDTQFATPPPPGSGTIAEARSALGSEVTFTGVVTRAMGDFAYLQDESGVGGSPVGITIRQTSGPFRDAITSGAIAPGTVLTVTGTPDEFQGRVQVNDANLASFSIDGTTDVPEPQSITAQEARDNGETYEAELIQITDLTTDASGLFVEFMTYDVMDATATLPVNIQHPDESVFPGMPIPSGAFTYTGVLDQRTSGYRLIPIQEGDLFETTTPPPPGTGITAARQAPLGTEVTFTGVVTRAMGDFAYLQDESGADGSPAALTIRQTSGPFRDAIMSGAIAPGTVLTVTGTTNEFQGLIQINDANLASFSIDGTTDVPEPQAITAQEARDNGEAYEAELIQIEGLTTDASGAFAAFSYYDVMDATATLPLYIQNPEETVFVGTPIPTGAFSYVGVLDQKSIGYRLIPIQEGDLPAATAPEITVSVTTLAFGNVTIGDTEELAVTVTNEGNADLAVSGVGVSGNAAFSIVSGDGAGTIEPGSSRNVVVRFAPTVTGPASGSLTITSDDADEGTVTVALSGTGAAPAPTECDYAFAIVNLNGTTVPSAGGTLRYKFQIDNSGNAMAATVDVWATAEDASGDVIFIRTPRTPTIPAGSVYRAGYNQLIPAETADGVYIYTVYAGRFNEADPAASEACGSDTFSVSKGDVASKAGSGRPIAAADWAGVEVLSGEIVPAMALGLEPGDVRVAPNPTRAQATFAFALAADADVSLALYDVRGREVAVVAEGPMTAGAHAVSLGRELPAGVYVWRLVAGDRVETGRLTVVR